MVSHLTILMLVLSAYNDQIIKKIFPSKLVLFKFKCQIKPWHRQRNHWNFQIKLHCGYVGSNGKGLKDFLGSFNRQLLQKLWKYTQGFRQKNDIDL